MKTEICTYKWTVIVPAVGTSGPLPQVDLARRYVDRSTSKIVKAGARKLSGGNKHVTTFKCILVDYSSLDYTEQALYLS